MPELPEVETIRRHLEPFAVGRRLETLEVFDPLWCAPAPPATLDDAVRGRRIESLGRRGKYLIWSFEDEVHLVMHLRMTGNLLIVGDRRPPYTRVLMKLDDPESTIAFTDPRRFGTGVVLLGDDALEDYFKKRLGVEPLSADFTTDHLRELARKRKQPVKAFLLNQERIAGVGNIYADEALFKSRIHPERPVGTLKREQLEALREAVIESLEAGIDSRGASIDDYRQPDGAQGLFQTKFQVHLRAGEPCIRCGSTIVKMRAAGRGTYVCETCQPKPRRRSKATAAARAARA